ncbi:MAG: hypothetical protein WCI96_14100 [Planctomycetota bacterium]
MFNDALHVTPTMNNRYARQEQPTVGLRIWGCFLDRVDTGIQYCAAIERTAQQKPVGKQCLAGFVDCCGDNRLQEFLCRAKGALRAHHF